MSTAGQAIGGVVGAAAGFILSGGNPMGAVYGAQIGMSIGGYLDPPKGPEQQGPRLSDLSVQTSTYGAFIPRVYGTVPINGNVFWLEKNQLKEVVRKEESGGKGGGGGSSEVTTYSYYATLAIGLCEGPIAGIRRVWAGPNLVYDAGSDDLESIIASNQAAQKNFTFYLGAADQQPDSRMQADLGVANTSAHRGLAYIVVRDFALAKYGDAIPGFKVEVVGVSDSYELPLIAAQAMAPGVQAYITGRPGSYRQGLAVVGTLYGPKTAWRLSRSGNVSSISGSLLGLDDWTPYAYMNKCLDSNDIVLAHSTAGTERLLFLSGDSWTEYVTPYDMDNCRYYERAGHRWFRWTDDANNPGGNPTGTWMAKIYEDGGLTYSARVDGFSLEDSFCPTHWGTILRYSCTCAINVAGVLYLNEYTESGSVVRSFSVAVNARACQLDDQFSASYVDAAGRLHVLFMLYREPNPLPAEYGKFYYLQIDVQSGACIKQGEVFFPEYVSLGHVRPYMLYEEDGVVYLGAAHNDATIGGSWVYGAFAHTVATEEGVPLAEVLRSEARLTQCLTDSDILTTGISDLVAGYRVASIGSIRAAVEPLQGVFPFDVVQSGYKLKFQARGGSSVVTITTGDLGVEEQLRQVREMDSQLPRKVAAKYLDKGRNYDSNEQTWERPGTEAVNTRALDLPIVLGASQALQVVERLGYLYWLERVEFGPFQLPPIYGYLEPADVITLEAGYATYELHLTTVNYQSDGSLACTARLNNAAVYQSLAESDDVPDGETVALAGESSYVLLDIPVVDEVLQNAPGMVAVMAGETSGWPGGVLFRSGDGGQTWPLLQAFSGKCTFGTVRGTLGGHAGNILQRGGTLTVDLVAGQLSSISEEQMLNGKNIAAYGADGRWEILRFANAVLNADGSYTLSLFWRGDRGTEWATGQHQAGDQFVLLDDPDGAFIGLPSELIGVSRDYRGVTAGADIDSVASSSFTYRGVNLECLSPVQPKGARNGSGDLAISWVRRTRIGGAWRDNVDASLGETSERYEVDVMAGATVKRTLSSSTPSVTYSAADQTTDFGSAQSAITLRIYQLSELVGRGYPLETTL